MSFRILILFLYIFRIPFITYLLLIMLVLSLTYVGLGVREILYFWKRLKVLLHKIGYNKAQVFIFSVHITFVLSCRLLCLYGGKHKPRKDYWKSLIIKCKRYGIPILTVKEWALIWDFHFLLYLCIWSFSFLC